ncbi:MAG TPA: cytidine deaminase [Anaerolineae bacterium]|nr:cytidine deaminase [Anaerolineae bacterium]
MPDDIQSVLIARAMAARAQAYAPYSNYRVGAALLAVSGKIYDGANVENAVYPVGICAERTALVKAVSEGERRFEAIAVATHNGGSPCGACRQMLSEFGLDLKVFLVDGAGMVVHETTLHELLPRAFGAADLKVKG